MTLNFAFLFGIVLSHILMSSAQGQGGWGGSNGASTFSSSSVHGQPGQPGHSDVSYGYGGVDAHGVPYGGSSGNGGFHINASDRNVHSQAYSGGQGGYGGSGGQPGQPGQSGGSGYGYGYSSASSWSSAAWNTFYVIAVFSLFVILKV